MPPLIIIVASLNLSVSGVINIVAQPSKDLDECRMVGELAIKAAATVGPGSYASYVCHDTAAQQGLTGMLGVAAYVRASDNKIKIMEGYKPTLAECKAMGMAAVASSLFSGGMAWVCYHLHSFEQ